MGVERLSLAGKIALVTGGSRGIGRALAVGLAEHGADVAIVYASAGKEADEAAIHIRSLGRQAWVFQQDLGQSEQLAALADHVWDQVGKVDILVNNAGLGFLERFNEITPSSWARTMAVNLDAMFFLSQRVAEHMIAQGIKGRIINLSSTNGFVAEAGLAHYNASKGGVEMLSRSLAVELGPHGITVNTICPGIIQTQIGGDFSMDVRKFLDYFQQHVPLEHRLGTVEECVGAAVLLASPAGSYITGQHIVIDGGVICEQYPLAAFLPPYQNSLASQEA